MEYTIAMVKNNSEIFFYLISEIEHRNCKLIKSLIPIVLLGELISKIHAISEMFNEELDDYSIY